MAGETDLILDGFRLLNRMPVAEIQKRILWLEEALASYRTLLAVRQLMDNRPEGLTVPPDWESAVDLDRREQAREQQAATAQVGSLKRGQLRAAILEHVKKFPKGIHIRDVATSLNRSYQSVYKILMTDRVNYVSIGKCRWVYCGDGSSAVIAELVRSSSEEASKEPDNVGTSADTVA